MRRHAIIPAAALAGALASAAGIAGCSSSSAAPAPFPAAKQATSAAPHGAPMILATEPAPGYLTGAQAPQLPSSGTLKLLTSLKTGVSIPWGLVSRDASTGAVTVDVDDGGCVSAPFGYTASGASSTSVVITIYSISQLKDGEACGGVGHIQSFKLTLPPADTELTLVHAYSQ